MFTNKAPSWGFEKLFDMGLLYNWRKVSDVFEHVCTHVFR